MRGENMRVAIIDDDSQFCQFLYQKVDQMMKTLFCQYSINIYDHDLDQLILNDDLIFLDIDLKDLNGIEIVKKQMKQDQALIIFVSSRDDLVFSSLSVRPFYFVRKSCLSQDLHSAFVLLKQYYKEHQYFVSFSFKGRQTHLLIKDIFLIESCGHDMILHTKNGDYHYRSTMKEMLEAFNTHLFVQFQKAYAVNLDHILEINKGIVILKDHQQFNIGRKYKEDVMNRYKEHLLR